MQKYTASPSSPLYARAPLADSASSSPARPESTRSPVWEQASDIARGLRHTTRVGAWIPDFGSFGRGPLSGPLASGAPTAGPWDGLG